MENKILQLFDEEFVIALFKKRVLPLYPWFKDIKKVKIQAHKKNIWENSYHVVIEFKTIFLTSEGKKKELPIFCSAHSEEPRKNVYTALKFLWNQSFSSGYLSIPHPLFYSDFFRATFYRGVNGRNLYQFIRERELKEIELIVPKAAAWFAKLHKIPTVNAHNFNKKNSRIETVIPGIAHILFRINIEYPKYYQFYKEVYQAMNSQEKIFFKSTSKLWIVHGDAHPENIIKMSEKKIGVIDFTDLCLADFTRDVGSFLQQIEFMMKRKGVDDEFRKKIKDVFLNNYLKFSKIKLNSSIEKRINLYYYWTALRTATFFLIKDDPEPERAEPLINEIKQKFSFELK